MPFYLRSTMKLSRLSSPFQSCSKSTAENILAAIIVGGFQVLYFGISEPAVIAVMNILLVGTGFSLIANLKTSRKSKWIYSMIFLFAATSMALLIAFKLSILFLEITTIFSLSNIFVAWVAFIYAEYLSEFIKLHQSLKNDATKDFLTGLNNVRQFDVSFNNVSQLTMKKGKRLSLLFIDIDYFKNINDKYGHTVGDIILKSLSEILI
jgi:diguanylate cyclase